MLMYWSWVFALYIYIYICSEAITCVHMRGQHYCEDVKLGLIFYLSIL